MTGKKRPVINKLGKLRVPSQGGGLGPQNAGDSNTNLGPNGPNDKVGDDMETASEGQVRNPPKRYPPLKGNK